MATNNNLRFNVQADLLNRSTFRGLRSPGLFAKWPMVGIMMLLLGSLLFGALAYNVTANGPFLQWDMAVARAFHASFKNVPSSLVEYLIFAFFAGKELVIAIATILSIYFLYKQYWRELAMVVVGLGGGWLLWYSFSRYFDRPRPEAALNVLPLTDPSFPSGLALSAVLCYGLLAYLLVPRLSSRTLKWFFVITLTLIILFIGFSTLLLGNHYPTDVIAGYALGLAWAGLVYTLMESFFNEKTFPNQQRTPEETSFEGLHTPGLFRARPAIGFILILVGGLSLAALGYNLVAHGPLLQLDTTVYRALITRAKSAPPVVNEIMIFGFFLGKQVVLVIVSILGIYFIYKRFWRELAMLLMSSAVGSIVWNFIIPYFARPRPPIQTGLAVTTIPSFPSGHTMSAIIVYGFLAYLLVPRMHSYFWKWTIIIVSALIILFIGFSRVFQGGHYLTDVLGGYALGLAWAGLVFLIIENIYWRRKV
jgi:membrane-associated phospholipid phosphatase